MRQMGLTRRDYEKRAAPCCGRKPLVYMREGHEYCTRCNRAYALEGGHQVNNWAWKHWGDQWRPTYPDSDYVQQPGRAALRSDGGKE